MKLLEQYATIRFRMWSNGIVWVIYEACPEEGDTVSKKLRQFEDKFEATKFIEKHRELYVKWLQNVWSVTQTATEMNKPTLRDTIAALEKKPDAVPDSSGPGPGLPSRGGKGKPKRGTDPY